MVRTSSTAERQAAGLQPVVIGTIAAAQLHVEASLEGFFSSHWGVDGLKPYMQLQPCVRVEVTTPGRRPVSTTAKTEADYYWAIEIFRVCNTGSHDRLDGEPRPLFSMILDPWHRAVNIGLAWNVYNFSAIQHFEGGYVEHETLPAIEDLHLILASRMKNGAGFDRNDDLVVQVYYDPPPHPLTRGQLARIYCYGAGVQVASLRPLPDIVHYYTEDHFTTAYAWCPNP